MRARPCERRDTLEQWARVAQAVTAPARLEELERFRRALVRLCGEEPRLTQFSREPVRSEEDLTDMALTDYLGLALKARHAALYCYEPPDAFRCVAAFGREQQPIPADWLLPAWLWEQGVLIRSQACLESLSVEEAERLLDELDRLGAHLAVPLGTTAGLWGMLVLGPPLGAEYGPAEPWRLILYGWRLLRDAARRQVGRPTRSQCQAQEEMDAFMTLRELWSFLKPPTPLRLLILEEMPKAMRCLQTCCEDLGLTVYGTTAERTAVEAMASFDPHVALVDLSLNRTLPRAFLQAATRLTQETTLIGLTTGEYRNLNAVEARALSQEFGVAPILRKPCTIQVVRRAVLEAALPLSLRERSEAPDASSGG